MDTETKKQIDKLTEQMNRIYKIAQELKREVKEMKGYIRM